MIDDGGNGTARPKLDVMKECFATNGWKRRFGQYFVLWVKESVETGESIRVNFGKEWHRPKCVKFLRIAKNTLVNVTHEKVQDSRFSLLS